MFVLVKFFLAFYLLFSTYSQGIEFYDPHSQRCCEGQARTLPEPDPNYLYMCCGPDLYKYEWKLEETSTIVTRCCQDKLYRDVNRTAQCCGTEVYEETSHACYYWGRDDLDIMNGIGLGFEVVPLPPNSKVCGKSKDDKTFYNPVEQICCSGVLYNRTIGMQCCGDSYINRTVSMCCSELVKGDEKRPWKFMTSIIHNYGVIPKNFECCNGSVIDAETQGCCAGNVVDFPTNFSKESFMKDSILMLSNFNDMDLFRPYCCKTQLMTDLETQVCVDRERVEIRENRNQVFCDEGWHQIDGNEALNVYCIDRELLKLNETQAFCSVNGTKIQYDSTKTFCLEDELVDMPDGDVNITQKGVCYKSARSMLRGMIFPNLMYRPTQ